MKTSDVDIHIALNWLASHKPMGIPTDEYPEHIRQTLDGHVISWGGSKSQDGSCTKWVEVIEAFEDGSFGRRWKRTYQDD